MSDRPHLRWSRLPGQKSRGQQMIIVNELVSLGQESISSFGRQALQLMGPLYAIPAQRPTSTPTGIQTHSQSAFTQQWVRSPSQRTGRIVSQRHLRAVVTKYVRHYNSRHPHRACDLRPPSIDPPRRGPHSRTHQASTEPVWLDQANPRESPARPLLPAWAGVGISASPVRACGRVGPGARRRGVG